MKFCEECGTQLDDDAVFCEECGAAVETEEPQNQYSTQEDNIQTENIVSQANLNKNKKKGMIVGLLLTFLVMGVVTGLYFSGMLPFTNNSIGTVNNESKGVTSTAVGEPRMVTASPEVTVDPTPTAKPTLEPTVAPSQENYTLEDWLGTYEGIVEGEAGEETHILYINVANSGDMWFDVYKKEGFSEELLGSGTLILSEDGITATSAEEDEIIAQFTFDGDMIQVEGKWNSDYFFADEYCGVFEMIEKGEMPEVQERI